MEILSYLYEIVFLSMGAYCFAFCMGWMKPKDTDRRKRAEEFRQSIQPWGAILSFVLALLFGVSLLLHISQS